MAKDDLRQLRAVLREAVQAVRISTRDWERRLGVGHGNLEKLLDGTLELRVRHLLAFAQLLRVAPGELLDAGCPDLARQAEHRVSDWIASARASSQPAPTESPGLSEEVVAAIREAVRREMAENSGPKKTLSPPKKQS